MSCFIFWYLITQLIISEKFYWNLKATTSALKRFMFNFCGGERNERNCIQLYWSSLIIVLESVKSVDEIGGYCCNKSKVVKFWDFLSSQVLLVLLEKCLLRSEGLMEQWGVGLDMQKIPGKNCWNIQTPLKLIHQSAWLGGWQRPGLPSQQPLTASARPTPSLLYFSRELGNNIHGNSFYCFQTL